MICDEVGYNPIYPQL